MASEFPVRKLTRDDCANRVYEGKECVRFDVTLVDAEEELTYEMRFYKLDGTKWLIRMINDALPPCFSMNVFQMEYEVPNRNASLEFIASVGMRYLMRYEVDVSARASVFASMLNEICL